MAHLLLVQAFAVALRRAERNSCGFPEEDAEAAEEGCKESGEESGAQEGRGCNAVSGVKIPGLPKVIKIGLHSYRVKPGVIDDSRGFLFGRTTSRATLIEVDHTVAASQIRDTVLHEVLHAVINDFPHELDNDAEEALVRGLAPGVLAVLRDNPQLIAFLLKD